jgi:DNA-directed RNA polymerase specialized sigma24 family protein
VELATAYLNPSPQLKRYTNQILTLASRPNQNPDPNRTTRPGTGTAWALNRRLSEATRTAIIAEYQAGTRQQTLADRHGISLSSVKRLLRSAS